MHKGVRIEGGTTSKGKKRNKRKRERRRGRNEQAKIHLSMTLVDSAAIFELAVKRDEVTTTAANRTRQKGEEQRKRKREDR
jgi:hypothetical protein